MSPFAWQVYSGEAEAHSRCVRVNSFECNVELIWHLLNSLG